MKFASEPFCFAEFILREGRAGLTVINASLLDSFYPIREDIIKYYSGATVLEFIKQFYRESIISSEGFFLAVEALKNIAYGEDFKRALVSYLLSAVREIGYALETHGCYSCMAESSERMFFDYELGAFYCSECFNGNGREINPETFFALGKVERGEDISAEESLKALRLLDYYLSNKTGENVNSLKELLKMLA